MQVSGSKIAFIGTGVMGASMASHLIKAGAQATVYNRTKSKADTLIAMGAIWADTPAKAVAKAEVVFTMVGYPSDVEEIYLGKNGILVASKPGTIFVDTTTSDPSLAIRISAAALASGTFAIDAPVSGGDSGARNATLTIMAGGDEATFTKVKPFFDVMGKTTILQGGPGAGQHTKAANQIAVAGSLLGTIEALLYSEKAGLDPRRALESIGGGSAQSWQLANNGPKMLDGNLEAGFYAKHFLKDLRIALDAARSLKVHFPMLELAESLFVKMQDNGFAEKGTQALYRLYSTGLV